ncbi:MAG: hypothetical protein FJ100_18025 [Deltaproteobacteria bacterium]|nr:hypothetical protein [Deltaproteobacteria bacterium]
MNITVLAVLAAGCGALAIYLWTAQSKLNDTIKGLKDDLDKARVDAKAQADRAEAARKKAEAAGKPGGPAPAGGEDKAAKDIKAQLVAAKEQLKQTQAAVKRLENEAHDSQIKLRKAESRVEELAAALAHPPKKGHAPAEAAPPPPGERPRAERRHDDRDDNRDDGREDERAPDPERQERMERAATRRAELEAERAARLAEAEKAKAERDTARAARQEGKDQEFIARLKEERERLKQLVFSRELELRIVRRKAEHNRQAYIMTLGALDLAEDELYRIKHGRERPDYEAPREDGEGGDRAAELPDSFAASADERAAAVAAADAALAEVAAAAEPAPDPEAPASQPEADAAPGEPSVVNADVAEPILAAPPVVDDTAAAAAPETPTPAQSDDTPPVATA